MESVKKYYDLILASFLHDIGKFAQRAGVEITDKTKKDANIFLPGKNYPTHKHILYTYQFLREYNFSDFISSRAAAHHKPQDGHLDDIIQKADVVSASERLPNESAVNYGHLKKHLVPLFSEIKLNEELIEKEHLDIHLDEYKPFSNILRYDLQPLSLEKDIIFPKPLTNDDETEQLKGNSLEIKEKYKNLWNDFIKEFKRLPQYDNVSENYFFQYFTSLYYLMLKYTWSIPSAVYHSIPDVSLFNHSKTTTTLASAIYKNKQNNKEKFTAISVDLSGIQKFIYDITNQKGFTSLIRGRSFLVSQMINLTAYYILDDLDLPITNLLYAGGGNLLILSYELEQSQLDKLEENIQSAFFDKFQTDIIPVFTSAQVDFSDIQQFYKVKRKIQQNLNNKKHQKYNKILQKIFQLKNDNFIEAGNMCPSCHKNKIENEIEEKCYICSDSIDMSQKLLKSDSLILSKNTDTVFSLSFGNAQWGIGFSQGNDIPREAEGQWLFKINDTNGFLTSNNKTGSGFIFLANTVPVDTTNEALTFEQIAINDKLALFKGDIDNLGLLFNKDAFPEDIEGENKYSMSRLLDMSFLIDTFFSGYVNTLINTQFKDKIYLMYSGGDDIMAVAKWDDMLEFVKTFNQEFREYTCNNPFIHISAGVEIFKHKYPIYDVVKNVNTLEEKAKTKDKDKIAVFGDVVHWDKKFYKNNFFDFAGLLDFGKQFKQFVKSKNISSGFIYFLLQLHQYFHIGEPKENYMWIPYLAYMLERNVKNKNKDEIDNLIKKLKTRDFMAKIKIPAYYYELFNRSKEDKNVQ